MKTIIMKFSICSYVLAFLITAGSGISQVLAQPSGEPYGPVPQNYELPDTDGAIYYVAPNGNEEYTGDKLEQPTTLSAAIKKVKSGDVIILRGGTYRTGNLRFNQGITLQPFREEKPVLKGTYIASEWKAEGEALWATSWPYLFPADPEDWWRRDREEKYTPLHRFNDDMVFIDGRFLQSAGNTEEVDENTFFIDYEKKQVYIGTDPTDKLVEITAFNVAIHRIYQDYKGLPSDGIGPIIRGIEFTQYSDTAILIEGTYPEGLTNEAEYGNDVRGTVLENCEISYCSRIGAYLMGDDLIVRNCKVSNTSTEGVYLVGASDVLLEKNIFTKNNIENLTGYYPSAVKIFNQCYRVTCRDNLVTDLPNSNGIWYDVGNVDGVFINNWVENVGISLENRYRSGFFFEISKGAKCVGNVFINCDIGSFVLNSCDVELYQNTYNNSKVVFARNERSAADDHFGWHPATGPDVDERDGHVFMNNLIVNSAKPEEYFLDVYQPLDLYQSLSTLQFKSLDHNVYVSQKVEMVASLINWHSIKLDSCNYKFNSPEELNKLHPDFAAHSLFLENYQKVIFKNISENIYQLAEDFSGIDAGAALPENISKLLGRMDNVNSYVGAFPVLKVD